MKTKFHEHRKCKKNAVSKKILFTIGIFLCLGGATAQTNLLDKQLQKVDQSSVTSGIIYDRVLPLADLNIYNMPSEKPHNTSDFRFFQQALFELHKASNYKKLISIDQLEKNINQYKDKMNVVPIGIINTPFQSLNYNQVKPEEGGLILKDSLFAQIPEKEPFLNGYAMVIAPLKNVMQGEQIIYKFSEDLIFNNGDLKIKSLIADFGDGKKQTIIENGALIVNEITIDNSKENGDKTINFSATLSNDFIFYTKGSIYTIFGNPPSNDLTTQPIACSSNLIDPNGLIENFSIDYVQAAVPFQGSNESAALKGQIEPRVFYHTKNGTAQNYQKTLLKPILIIDGFDPSDGRKIDDCDCERDPVCQEANKNKTTGVYDPDNHLSFVELMKYKDDSTTPVFEKNLITVLREKGYDVILVNLPTYTTDGVTVDGGADYIERNAMAFVELLKQVNSKLQTNGSTEKLVVVGPSMGGQISRYALAYMEKKFAETGLAKWQHNTRIWVAFDSPNHGANVPLGDQALIKMLANAENNSDAQKSFNKLQSIAANEMLINYFKTYQSDDDDQISNNHYFNLDLNTFYSNASTVSQGMPVNTGNPYFQEHYNKQFNNGLPNSHGFPLNLRKIAIVNGSLSGKTFGDGYEKILDVSLFKTIRLVNWNIFGWHVSSVFHSKLFQAETYSMPTSINMIARTEKLRPFDGNDTHILNCFANSIRGNLDNVPGGSIDATDLLHSSITGAALGGPRSFWQYTDASLGSFYVNHIGFTPEWETDTNKPNQCFIPTFSSIGMKNPNQSWANPLNRNLVCSDETYFDSYFGETNNTPHVQLNYRSVNWLLQELDGNPQTPNFPIQDNLLSGDAVICDSSNKTYTIADVCKVPSPVIYTNQAGATINGWSTTQNLHVVSYTPYSITVNQVDSGQGIITATFQNGQTITKSVWVGKPNIDVSASDSGADGLDLALIDATNPSNNIQNQGITTTTWQVIGHTGSGHGYGSGFDGQAFGLPGHGDGSWSVNFKITATNICGTTELYTGFGGNTPLNGNKINTNNSLYNIYPNPSNDIVTIDLRDQNNQPEKGATISGELFDIMGLSKTKVEIINNKATFSVCGLNKGIYVLKIYINDQIENHQIAVE